MKAVVHQRIGNEKGDKDSDSGSLAFLSMAPPIDMVERLFKARKLDGNVIGKAVNAGDHSFVLAALIVRSELDPVIVKRIFLEKSAKGIMALAWKSGLSGRMGVQMQQRMGRIAPSEVLMPADDDDYPLSDDELRWQLEFYTDLCTKGAG